jgi:hypothetical protein
VKAGYSKEDLEILAIIWGKEGKDQLLCPQCKHSMIIIQLEPIIDSENAYFPYDTVIECTNCDFRIKAESFTILGCVRNFNLEYIEIASWSPSGSRVISRYEHVLDYNLLRKLKESTELKEFLVVNDRVVQVIG